MQIDDTAQAEADYVRRDTAGNRRVETKVYWSLVAVVAVLLAAGAAYRYAQQERPSAPTPVAAPAHVEPKLPATLPDGTPKHPVPSTADDAASLPALPASDGYVRQGLLQLLGADTLARFLYPSELIRRFVATVDNLPRHGSLTQVRALRPPPGAFAVAPSSDGMIIAAHNDSRYSDYVRVFESLDTDSAVALYRRLYPLFQEQYRLLGFPSGHFNDRVIEAIDDLLAAPDVPTPIALVQPRVMYQFADDDLERLSAGRKAMIRLGGDNARRVKDKLRELRRALLSPH